MAQITIINTSATIQVKSGSGRLHSITVVAAGTGWTMQVNDGPNATGGLTRMIGQTAMAMPAAGTVMDWSTPQCFSNGLQFVMAGATPGEISVEWS